ncbi:MAG: GNAT family N-acetyltransferase [Clostridiales bacterium]|nr:GNAT family N-acetyltransferase [Clostridiales bacterium]
MRFDIAALSQTCAVRPLNGNDLPELLTLCRGNPQYYRHCPPTVSEETLRSDMTALPPGKTAEDRYYLGFWSGERLAAVLDLVLGYPDGETAFIGFFMVAREMQGRGFGSALVEELCAALNQKYRRIRLAYVRDNRQSESFWRKNGFHPTGERLEGERYTAVLTERELAAPQNEI